MKTRIGEVKSHGSRADKSKDQVNESRGRAKALTVLNTCETVAMGDSGGTGARLDAGDARRGGVGPDGHANWSDVSSGHRDVPDIRNGMNTTADTKETISTRPEDTKAPDLPTGSTTPRQDGTDRLESHAGTQMACIHVQDIADKSNTSANVSVKSDLPARGAEPCVGEPNRLDNPTDASDVCTRMQSIADGSRRPANNLEHVRRSQNSCKRSNLPVKSLKTRPEEPRKPSDRADASSGHTHAQSGWIDAKMTARMAEVISTTPNKQKPPNSPIGAGSWCRNETDGLGNVADASTTCTDVQSDRNGARTTAKTCETISKTLINPKTPNSPVSAKIRCIGKEDGWGNHADGSGVCRDMQRAEKDSKTAENTSKNVKMGQMRSKTQNSPCRVEIETAERPGRCEHVSDKGNDAHTPHNVPIESLGTRI